MGSGGEEILRNVELNVSMLLVNKTSTRSAGKSCK